MAFSSTILLLALTSCIAFIGLARRSRAVNLPPGPKGLPLLGNLFELAPYSKGGLWHLLMKWKQAYGDVVSFRVINQTFIVLNSSKAVNDLLERRAANYSERAHFIVADHMVRDNNVFMLNTGPKWRSMRRSMHEALHSRASNAYLPLQMRGGIHLACEFLRCERPLPQPATLIIRSTSSVIATILYGLLPGELSDTVIADLNEFAVVVLEATIPGAYLVNHFGFLQYLPGKWRSVSDVYYETWSKKFLRYFSNVKERQNGQASPSFCAKMVEDAGRHGLSDIDCAWLAASLYTAGIETSIATIGWLIFALVAYPDVQRRVHDEIDKVVGRSRVPTYEDIEKLPYFRAVVKEILRWRPTVPAGVIHASKEDDIYEDSFIPKGALIIPNVLALNHDPEVYGPDASQFRPERFLHLGEDGVYTHKPSLLNRKDDYGFGFGRRICPGRHLATNTIYSFVIVLWAMYFEGEIKDLEEEKAVTIFSYPPTFECTWKPRFLEAEGMLMEASEKSED